MNDPMRGRVEAERAQKYELAGQAEADPCWRCGHEFEDHGDPDLAGLKVSICVTGCDCPGYLAPDAEQDAEDAAIARWEQRREERE